jgi:hypothetical protein
MNGMLHADEPSVWVSPNLCMYSILTLDDVNKCVYLFGQEMQGYVQGYVEVCKIHVALRYSKPMNV